MYILPKGYRGLVLVIYNQQSGKPAKYIDGKRVFEIPGDGILKTQFSPNRDWHRPDTYFYVENGKMIEIPYIEHRDLKGDPIHVCCFSSGKADKRPNDNSIDYDEFYVGTKSEIEKAMEKAHKMKIADLIEPPK